jgi:hypothetical protein
MKTGLLVSRLKKLQLQKPTLENISAFKA